MQFNNSFLEMLNKPSSSFDFMQALKKAKEESLELQNKSNNDTNRINERIKKYNLILNPDTDNTGDCQFDSVADQLKIIDSKYDGITKEEVRSITIEWLRRNADYKLNSEDPNSETLRSWVFITQEGLDWTSYCDKMSKSREWGDEITFKAMTEAFNIIIVLISSTVDENNFLSEHIPKHTTPKTKKVYLCHFLEVHYCSLITPDIFKRNEEKKKEQLISLLERSDPNLQKRTISDVFCMDSPQNEIPQSLLEEMFIENKCEMKVFFENLQNITNVFTIKLHRIKDLEEKLGPKHVLSIPNLTLTNVQNQKFEKQESGLPNQGLLENLLSKIKSLEELVSHKEKQIEQQSNEISLLKRLIEKQNVKIVELEHNELIKSSIPTKNELIVKEILGDEIVLKWVLVDKLCSGFFVDFYKGDIFEVRQFLPNIENKNFGELFFQKPPGVYSIHFKLYSPKKEVLATSDTVIVSQKIIFDTPKLVDDKNIVVKWENPEDNKNNYDWVGLFKSSNLKQHLQYNYISVKTNEISFSKPYEKGSYTIQYFSGLNKYLPISSINLEIE